MRFLRPIVLMFAVLLWPTAGHAQAQACAAPASLRFEVTGKITRNKIGFTQGLEFRDGKLYESTGKIGGTTQLNTISLSGQVTTLADLGTTVFGEGLTILNDEVIQLTWQERQVFVYDLAGKPLRTMRNPRDGWGLSNDGTQLLFTDGEGAVHFADPKDFSIKRSLPIRSGRESGVQGVNELEYVDGKLFGNVFTTWFIVRIDPATGCIDGVADLRGLEARMTPDERRHVRSDDNHVLNGIAFDPATAQFYLTGKRWQSIFVGRFAPAAR